MFAPLVAQLSVLPVPELMLVGFAVKDVIAGSESFQESSSTSNRSRPVRRRRAE